MFNLVITSTVYVSSNNTILIDSNERIRQYVESFLFYLDCKTIQDIIICDNSGFDYSKCVEFHNTTLKKNVEFLCFLGDNEKISEKGKGYGEGEIMEYVLKNSKLIRNRTSFCKVTGRVKILNIDSILRRINNRNNYFQRIGLNPFVTIKKVDTRFYHSTIDSFEQYLLKSYDSVNDNEGQYLEHVYYRQLNDNGLKYKSLNRLPNIKGISGSTGKTYDIKPVRWFFLKNIYILFKYFKIID